MDIQVIGVIVHAHGSIFGGEEGKEVPLLTSPYPTVIVLLNRSSTPSSLTPVGIWAAFMQDAVLPTFATILGIADSSDNRSELGTALRTNIDLDSVLVFQSLSLTVLFLDGRLTRNLEHEQSKQGVEHTTISAGLG